MSLLKIFARELEQESITTRKMLSRVPDDKYDWKPHEKSMTIRQLTTHIAELPTWIPLTLNTTELDFATSPYNPPPINNTKELMDLFEKSLAEGREAVAKGREEQLAEPWNLFDG